MPSADKFCWRMYLFNGGPAADKFVGGCIFVEHASGFLNVGQQVGFSAVDSVRAKHSYESCVWSMGMLYTTID